MEVKAQINGGSGRMLAYAKVKVGNAKVGAQENEEMETMDVEILEYEKVEGKPKTQAM